MGVTATMGVVANMGSSAVPRKGFVPHSMRRASSSSMIGMPSRIG